MCTMLKFGNDDCVWIGDKYGSKISFEIPLLSATGCLTEAFVLYFF